MASNVGSPMKAAIPEMRLIIYEARHLVSKNMTGKSDPYCVIKYLDALGKVIEKKKTSVVRKTISPVWTPPQEFTDFRHTASMSTVVVELWSYKSVGQNSFLGEVSFSRASLMSSDFNGWVKLQPRAGKKDKVTGELRLAISYEMAASEASSAGVGTLSSTEVAQGGPALYVTVVEARNCNPWGSDDVKELPWFNSCNPYFYLSFAGQTVRGPTLKRVYHPTWSFSHRFPLSSAVSEGADSTSMLSVKVKHWDRLSPTFRDKYIGSVTIPLGDFQPSVTVDRWYRLKHGQAEDAWVRLLVKHHDPSKMKQHIKRTSGMFLFIALGALLLSLLSLPFTGKLGALGVFCVAFAGGMYVPQSIWPLYMKSFELFPYLNPIIKDMTVNLQQQDEPEEEAHTSSRKWASVRNLVGSSPRRHPRGRPSHQHRTARREE